ncbi:MAG: CAP domain-containing protein [Eubacterium sp.]|nr:CAP domain-containing protein [Eubacterium sp.]
MKKIISVLLSAVLLLSVSGIGFTAFASEGELVTVTVTGTQNNETVKTVLDEINGVRAENSLYKLEYDKELMEAARLLAVKSALYTDNSFSLPDGSAITTVIPEYNNTCFPGVSRLSGISGDSVMAEIDELKTVTNIKSIGLAAFTCDNETALYIIVSTVPAGEIETDFTTRVISSNEKVLYTNLKSGSIDFISVKNGKYILKMKVTGYGVYSGKFNLADSDVVYKSSNSKIMKIRGKNAYVKKNGTVKLSSYTTKGSLLIEGNVPCNATTISPIITSLTGKKKRTAFIKWSKNITNANGYQLQYSTSKKFKKAKTVTIKGKKNIKKTIKKLKSGKVYYFRVRAYVNQGEGEKLFTPWSAKKKIKIK